MKPDDNILEIINATKEFPGVTALDNASFNVKYGEIHCLVGENGAGKSTLIKILSGFYPAGSYSGRIIFNGKEIGFRSTNDSRLAGISTIYQELPLVEQLNITENIALGNEISCFGVINSSTAYNLAGQCLKTVGLDVNPGTLVADISVGQQQLVAIAKALSQKSQLLILDEPTASLSDDDAEKLLEILSSLKKEGITIIYISHRLKEILKIADRVTVMRDGKIINTCDKAGLTESKLIRTMVGRELTKKYPRKEHAPGEIVLAVSHLSVHNESSNKTLQDITFSLRKGEILGLTGLVGAGRTELAMSLFGVWGKVVSGNVLIDGQELAIKSPEKTIAAGLGLVSEDRKRLGLVMADNIIANINLTSIKNISPKGVVNEAKSILNADKYVKQLNIRTPSLEQAAGNLSGGNQQKVVLGKWLSTPLKVLIFDEPTRGIDVEAKSEIYEIINQLVDRGIGIMIISSELEEILGICDRILVMYEGRISKELPIKEATQEKIMFYETGGAGKYAE